MRLSSWILLPLLAIFVLGLIGFHSVHASAPKGMVVVANKGDSALGIIDVIRGNRLPKCPKAE